MSLLIRKLRSKEELEKLFALPKGDPYAKFICFEYEIKRSAIVDGKVDMDKAFEAAKDVLVVEKDGVVVGFNHSTYGKRMNYCNSLDNYLVKEARGLKTAVLMMWSVIQEAQSRGLTRIKSRTPKKDDLGLALWRFVAGEPVGEVGNDYFWFLNIEGVKNIEELNKRCKL